MNDIDWNSVIKPANGLIDAVYRLETNELKIIFLAAKKVYSLEKQKQVVTSDTEFVISASEYAKEYGVTRQTAFEAIVDAKNSLFERTIGFLTEKNGAPAKGRVRWLSKEIESSRNGEIYIYFSSDVLPLIYLVEREFTMLDVHEFGRLNSKYATRLYQLLMRWRTAQYQPKIEYQVLRKKLGLVDEDADKNLVMADFKKNVINIAVRQLNRGTGFVNLKYETFKEGKNITHFRFTYDRYDNETINVTPMDEKKGKLSGKSKKATKIPEGSKKADSSDSSANQKQAELPFDQNLYEQTGELHFKPSEEELKFKHPNGMSQKQAWSFASQIVDKILDKDPDFYHLNVYSQNGEGTEEFKARLAMRFLYGQLEGFEAALDILGYKPSKAKRAFSED